MADRWQAILARYPGHAPDRLVPELIREQIGVMVNDVIEATRGRIANSGVQSVGEVRAAGHMIGGFSEAMGARERELKRFMYDNLYHHPTQIAAAEEARRIIVDLYAAYSGDTDLLPAEWAANLPFSEPDRSRHIADFLAGMTDRYAQNCHQKIFGNRA